MNIAIDVRFRGIKKNNYNPGFFLACIQLLADQKKEHRFLIIHDNTKPVPGNFSSNIEFAISGHFGKKGLLRKLLPDLKLAGILKKTKADALISFDEIRSVPQPQILVLSEEKKLNKKTTRDAALIIVNTSWQKTVLEKKYKPAAGKIEIIPVCVNDIFRPITEEEKEKIKEKYSGGKEFFLLSAKKTGEESFLKLLKSFSHFKKRQQSSINLVLLSASGKKLIQLLSNYKYRKDVILVEEPGDAETAALTAASYAVILTQDDQQPVTNTLQALKCGVPLIAPENSAVKEIAGSAVLYLKDDEELTIGEKMIRLYTDEALRNQLMNQGKLIAAKFTKQKMADSLWHYICKTVK